MGSGGESGKMERESGGKGTRAGRSEAIRMCGKRFLCMILLSYPLWFGMLREISRLAVEERPLGG